MNIMLFSCNKTPGGAIRFFNQLGECNSELARRGNRIFWTIDKDNLGIQYYSESLHLMKIDVVNNESILHWIYTFRDKGVIFSKIYFHILIQWYKLSQFRWQCRNIRRFREVLKKNCIDCLVVSSGGYHSGLCTQFMKAAFKEGIRKRVIIIHNYPLKRETKSQYNRGVFLDRMIDKRATDIITVSDFCKNEIQNQTTLTKDIHIIYNGLDKEDNDLSIDEKLQFLNVEKTNYIIGMLANFMEVKGQIHALQALDKMVKSGETSIKLLIIGNSVDQNYYEKCCNYIKKNNLDEYVIIKTGIYNAGRYAECFDIMLMPSVQNESFGLPVLEAMMYGKPVIAFATGGLNDVIENMITGVLVEKENEDKLAEMIIKVKNDIDLYNTLAKNAALTWTQKYSGSEMCRQYVNYILERI